MTIPAQQIFATARGACDLLGITNVRELGEFALMVAGVIAICRQLSKKNLRAAIAGESSVPTGRPQHSARARSQKKDAVMSLGIMLLKKT
ncbi:hypothetical protein A2cp1_1290 [Anaeromyxobacter dehalogenans 2CP-1]|uniref:Uncharacterized protein n=1 Tax=Anaeromyxobacter dehalogenans (strain ATCC BAA-258 / DSM 21875 / 2CP-1) TaxID=455488 RepID=B8JGG3_ANAD2|nr:hypothetical protein [Anaeromyxobacter dehalogenans]ACL64634.1 hypothetical protein A2cp1_1290 [Anaeromyxobacter dehalogenans 2CP-1]